MNNKEVKKKEDTFFYKYRHDSKYKAKVQLLGGFIFIIIVAIYARTLDSNISYNDYNNIETNEVKNEKILLNELQNNNYAYSIDIIKNINDNEEKIIYLGKRKNNKEIITKKINEEEIEEYYVENNNYYIYEGNNYKIASNNKVYDFLSYSFLEINTIINYINSGDKIKETNYNDGKVEKEYQILLKNILLNGNEDYIKITVIEDLNNNSIIFDIDYTTYYNLYDVEKVNRLRVRYNFYDINKIEKIVREDSNS